MQHGLPEWAEERARVSTPLPQKVPQPLPAVAIETPRGVATSVEAAMAQSSYKAHEPPSSAADSVSYGNVDNWTPLVTSSWWLFCNRFSNEWYLGTTGSMKFLQLCIAWPFVPQQLNIIKKTITRQREIDYLKVDDIIDVIVNEW